MNKFGVVLGVAAVATLAGCKDPDFKSANAPSSQNTVKEVAVVAEAEKTAPVKTETVAEVKPVAVPAAPVAAPVAAPTPVETPKEEEFTIYIVQNGDYLAKISKKYNVTIASIKRLNPSIKKDVIRVGQKLKLPGKIDVGVQKAPVKAVAAAPKKAAAPYTGATKEYVVKSGDTLGAIAYGNGLTIRQLKALNGLSNNSLKIGQKLKIPAEKVVAAKPAEAQKTSSAAVKKAEPEKKEAAKASVVEEKKAEAPAAEKAAEAKAPEAAPAEKPAETAAPAAAAEKKADEAAAPATTTYVVQEGDDITGVSIRWGVSTAQIRELNNLPEGAQLTRGQIIKLPADAQQ